jgi:hypothetical protein
VLHSRALESVRMVMLLIVASTTACLGCLGYLVWRGFYDGDEHTEVTVHARRLPSPGSGVILDVEIHNPGPSTALTACALRPVWHPRPVSARRTALRRFRLSLHDQVVGVLASGETTRFHVAGEHRWRALRLEVAIGTPHRLRLHQIAVTQAPLTAPRSVVSARHPSDSALTGT